MARAVIRKILRERGFGFCELVPSCEDIYFHASECAGQFETFEIGNELDITTISMSERGSYTARGVRLTLGESPRLRRGVFGRRVV